MADDPWAVFGRAPVAPGDQAGPAPPTGASAAPDAADPWAVFGRAPVEVQPAAPPSAPSAEHPYSFGHSFGLGVRNVVQGAVGPLYDLAGSGLRGVGLPVNPLADNLTALGLPQAETPGERMSQAVIEPVAGTLTGQGVGRALTTAASPVAQAIGGALQAQPVTQAVAAGAGGAVQQATGSPTAGLVTSMAVPFATGAGRIISPDITRNLSPERAALLRTAQNEDIPVSLAQMTGGKVARNFESTLAQLPGSSGVMADANAAQSEAWNNANLQRAGVSGETKATPEVLNKARDDLWAQSQEIISRNNLKADPALTTQLGQVRGEVNRYADPNVKDPVLARIEDAENMIAQHHGDIPGRAYQEMDSELAKEIRTATDGYKRTYLGNLRGALREAWDRSISPEDQASWSDWKQKYANLQVIAKAMDRPGEGTVMGDISPAALAEAGRNRASKSFAFGRGNMDDLSRLGQGMLKQVTPDSGTSQRTVMANMLQGKTAMGALGMAAVTQNPLFLLAPAAEVGIPNLAARTYQSDWLKGYLTNRLLSGVAPSQNPMITAGVTGLENEANRRRN